MTAATPPACDDCGEPGFVACPASEDKPALVLCCICYGRKWRAAMDRAQEAEQALITRGDA